MYAMFVVLTNTMAEISISIEIKYFGGDNNIIATFNIIPWINGYIFMYRTRSIITPFFTAVYIEERFILHTDNFYVLKTKIFHFF